MRSFARNILSVSLAMATMQANAVSLDNIDYWGYFRTGISQGESGSMMDAVGGSFQKQKLGRTGNEFDTYAEIGLGTTLASADEKSVYIQTQWNMYDGDSDSNIGEMNFGWESLNIQFRNFMGMGETSWVGMRPYNKSYVIDQNDYFYWNNTNLGAGIEGMKVGDGLLSVAALHRDIADSYSTSEPDVTGDSIDSNQLEITYDSLPLWDGATLAMGYKFLNADPTNEQKDENINRPEGGTNHDYADGHTAMLELRQAVNGTGFNRTTLQYYVDGSALQGVQYVGADTLSGNVKSGDGWAIRNYGVVPLAADWDLSHAINFAKANDVELWDGDEGDANAFSVSAKVTYHWTDITRTYAEVGYFDDEKTVNGTDYSRNGAKYTVAQAFSLGRGQPEIRFFASYFDSDNSDWDDTKSLFEDNSADDTWAAGIQAIVWW